MTSVVMNEFTGYDRATLAEFFRVQNDKLFKVIIPRRIHEPGAFLPELAEYQIAAFAGDLLAKSAETFIHNLPGLRSGDEFYFLIEIKDLEKFINAFHHIVSNAFEEIMPSDFDHEMYCFLLDYIKGKIAPHTKMLADVAKGIFLRALDDARKYRNKLN